MEIMVYDPAMMYYTETLNATSDSIEQANKK
jgi:hypothetical protein